MFTTLGRGLSHASSQSITSANIPFPLADLSPKTIALIGDSISAHNTSSNNQEYLAQGYITMLNAITGQRYNFPPLNNLGISGNRLIDMDARKADLSTLLETPDIVFVLGGTNDIPSSYTETQMIAYLQQIYDYITLTMGKKVIALTIPPRTQNNAGDTLTSAQLTKLLNVNNWIMSQSGNIIPIDIFTPLSDGISQPNPDYFGKEGDFGTAYVHFNPAGALIVGQTINQTLQNIYGTYDIPDMSIDNIISNNNLSGSSGLTGAQLTGIVADGYRISTYSDAVGNAAKPTPNSQQISYSYVANTADRETLVYLYEDFTQGYVSGDTLIAEAEIEILSAHRLMGLWVEFTDLGSSSKVYESMDRYKAPEYPTHQQTYFHQTPKAIIQAGNTALRLRIRGELESDGNDLGNVDFIIKQLRIKKL